jgi:hypothetical protein
VKEKEETDGQQKRGRKGEKGKKRKKEKKKTIGNLVDVAKIQRDHPSCS